MTRNNYSCIRCGHRHYETGELRATGGILSKIFDIQSRRFTTVTCSQCRHTELFDAKSSMLGNVFDFFTQ